MGVERKILKALGVGGSIALTGWFISFGVDQGAKPMDAYGQPLEGWPTWTPVATVTPPATATLVPTVIPLPTPNALSTQIAQTRDTLRGLLEIQQALDAFRPALTPVPPPVQQQLPPPGNTFIRPDIIPQQVVKPEMLECKPEVVKVPEPYKIEVPVPAKADPDFVEIRKKDFNDLLRDTAEKAVAEERKKTEKEFRQICEEEKTALIETTRQRTEAQIATRGWGFDWWSGIVGGVIGLGIGAVVFSRRQVVERVYTYYHRPHAP